MKPRRPPPLDAAAIEAAALRYLERFASSSENLRRILMRRVPRDGSPEASEAAARIDALVTRFLAAGLLDDEVYAAARTASLQRRGASRRGIAAKLAAKGVAREEIASALGGAADEIVAACALARRRRLGPYRTREGGPEVEARELGTFARAGFSLAIARRVLACRDEDELETLTRGG